VTAVDDPIATTLTSAVADVTGAAPLVEGVTYGADMRLLVNVGRIPTVLFGPGDVRTAHMPDEHVPIDDLRAVAQALTVTALRFCGVQD
jgi:acetylornithine deacetylase